jgi:hypothetical protein
MALPVLPGVVRASVFGPIAGGSRWSNTYHFRRVDLGDPTDAEIGLLHAELATFYGGIVLPQCAAPTALEAGGYTPLNGVSGALLLPAPITGSGGGNAMPAEVAEVLTIRTSARGRQNRGRIYLPAFAQAAFSADGHVNPGVVVSMLGGMVALRAAIALTGWELGVGSYGPYKNPVTHVLEVGTPHFTSCSVVTMDPVADVMRSRKS